MGSRAGEASRGLPCAHIHSVRYARKARMEKNLHSNSDACGPAWEHGVDLEKIDPESNCYRWYRISVQPDLFCAVALIRERGRLGNKGNGRRSAEPFEDLPSARRAMERAVMGKINRGYSRVTVWD